MRQFVAPLPLVGCVTFHAAAFWAQSAPGKDWQPVTGVG